MWGSKKKNLSNFYFQVVFLSNAKSRGCCVHTPRVSSKTRPRKKKEGIKLLQRGQGRFKRATPVKSVVRLMKTTSQVITANMALEGATSEEEKLTSRTI